MRGPKMEVKIVEWKEEYFADYYDISMEWLRDYDTVEPIDIEIITHPHENVLDDGGMIFFANCEGRNVGTISMIRMGDDCFELAKIGITKSFRGLGIGNQLMEAAIDFARRKGAKKIILFTIDILVPAVNLYHKFNFKDIPHTGSKYEDSDMKMELYLNT